MGNEFLIVQRLAYPTLEIYADPSTLALDTRTRTFALAHPHAINYFPLVLSSTLSDKAHPSKL